MGIMTLEEAIVFARLPKEEQAKDIDKVCETSQVLLDAFLLKFSGPDWEKGTKLICVATKPVRPTYIVPKFVAIAPGDIVTLRNSHNAELEFEEYYGDWFNFQNFQPLE